MKHHSIVALLIIMVAVTCTNVARADLSIYDVQYTTNPSGDSDYNGSIQNVTGGIVTHNWSGFNDRIYLQDPAHPTWGAIAVKDSEGDLVSTVEVGDWVSFEDIYIEEYRGTTFLQYRRTLAPDVSFNIVSNGNPVPDPVLLTAADLPVPTNHAASEPFESMIATLEDVTIGQMDLGKAGDNYELLQGGDTAWGADYMNIDSGGLYHSRIYAGAELDSITGVVEQYTKDSWDYYQLCTRFTADIVPEPGSLSLLVLTLALAGRRR